MVNDLVFRWPKPLFFMVLGAYGIYTWKTQHSIHHLLLFPGFGEIRLDEKKLCNGQIRFNTRFGFKPFS